MTIHSDTCAGCGATRQAHDAAPPHENVATECDGFRERPGPSVHDETHSDSDRIACPGCGAMHTDLWDYDWSGGREEVIVECDCGRSFTLHRRVDVTYTAKLLPAVMPSLPGSGADRPVLFVRVKESVPVVNCRHCGAPMNTGRSLGPSDCSHEAPDRVVVPFSGPVTAEITVGPAPGAVSVSDVVVAMFGPNACVVDRDAYVGGRKPGQARFAVQIDRGFATPDVLGEGDTREAAVRAAEEIRADDARMDQRRAARCRYTTERTVEHVALLAMMQARDPLSARDIAAFAKGYLGRIVPVDEVAAALENLRDQKRAKAHEGG
jgi:hypothetical protein